MKNSTQIWLNPLLSSFALTGSLLLCLCPNSYAKGPDLSPYTASHGDTQELAQREEELEELPNQFSPNPLLQSEPDPMFLELREGDNLTDEPREELATFLDELNLEAAALLAAGDSLTAFEIWNRELRLRRYLGPAEELAALRRVAAIAWDINQKLQVRWITQRLSQLKDEFELQETVDLSLLQALGLAFEEVRDRLSTIEVYQGILTTAKERENSTLVKQTLATIAQIELDWLEYDNAAIAYEELLGILEEENLLPGEEPPENNLEFTLEDSNLQPVLIPTPIETLQQLIFIYDRADEPLRAITAKERLTSIYIGQSNFQPIPELKIAIAEDYQLIGKLNLASQYYQEAYEIAQSIQQFYSASEALQKLGDLYWSQDRQESALEIYRVQLLMDREFYNTYGMMEDYDRIGQIHSQLEDYRQARSAFEEGLELATQLGGYRADYFQGKIDKLDRRFRR
ncbi:MAG: tetratricopeptide repeat protein [Okeania sp. SIO2H7]|nr:tetratricopeptide repeat protein [Okeania sp. SIO2H7]